MSAAKKTANAVKVLGDSLGPRAHIGHVEFLLALASHDDGRAHKTDLALSCTPDDVVKHLRSFRRWGLARADRATVFLTPAGKATVRKLKTVLNTEPQ